MVNKNVLTSAAAGSHFSLWSLSVGQSDRGCLPNIVFRRPWSDTLLYKNVWSQRLARPIGVKGGWEEFFKSNGHLTIFDGWSGEPRLLLSFRNLISITSHLNSFRHISSRIIRLNIFINDHARSRDIVTCP